MQTAILTVGRSSTRSFHSLGAAGATGSRLLITLRRISRQPSTVLIFKPSVENSTTPVAAAKTFRGRGLVRAAVLVPWAIPTVVTARMFSWLFDQGGLVNYLLVSLHLVAQPVNFLGSTTLALPTAPKKLVATPVSATEIGLTWTPGSSGLPLTGYYIFRGTSSSTLTQVATTGTTSYTNYSLKPETKYYYAVEEFDQIGNISPMSAIVSATTPAQ